MQNSSNAILRSASKTNAPAMVASAFIEVGKIGIDLASGKISGTEALERLGSSGTGMLSAATMGAVGQALIPIPLAGAALGSMIGYTLSQACYGALLGALKNAKLAKERRIQIEAHCKELIAQTRALRAQIDEFINKYLSEQIAFFNKSLDDMDLALKVGDTDSFLAANAALQSNFGKKAQFTNMKEFNSLMSDDSVAFKL